MSTPAERPPFDKIVSLAPGMPRPADLGTVPEPTHRAGLQGYEGYEYWGRYVDSDEWPESKRWTQLRDGDFAQHCIRRMQEYAQSRT